MLKPAQLYEQELQVQHIKNWYVSENYFWCARAGERMIELPDNNYNSHDFVSVDKYKRVIGYITYDIDWESMSVDNLGVISFYKGNLLFVKDLYTAICDIFEKYHMNRISWCCYADNPAINGYRKFIKRCSGRECGYARQNAKLMDGKMHDSVFFEVLACEFKKRGESKKNEMVNQLHSELLLQT